MEITRTEAAARLRAAVESAASGLIEREAVAEAIALCAVAGEHLLLIGPPGTAKSEAARRMAKTLGGSYFEYLLGRFTEPSELFGPIDLRRLREGIVETETSGMLPEADLAFLDEIFLGSTAILNTLLAILNERTFRRGSTQLAVPLRLCIGASNALPDEGALAAFADRFLVRLFLDPVADALLEDLLEQGWNRQSLAPEPLATLADLDSLSAACARVELASIRPTLAQALRTLRQAGVTLSDRRAVRTQRLIAAAATLAGRTEATPADLWPLIYAVPTREEQALAREALRPLLAATENAALPHAAEEASLGPLARAQRLSGGIKKLLAAPPDTPDALAAWKLRLEGALREIDAGFAPERLPTDLAQLRQKLIEWVRV